MTSYQGYFSATGLLAAFLTLADGASAGERAVVINGAPLASSTLQAFEQHYRVRIAEGRYWYDRATGAWGVEGGPTAGFVLPGLDLGGTLRPDASGGGTGVYINGRELHPLDVAALQQFTVVYRGRYWVDAYGNGGLEGGPVLFNLVQLARAAGGGRGGPWSYHGSTGGHVGGDGQGFSYYIDKDVSWSSGP